MLPISFFLEFVVFLDLIFPVIAASFIIVAQKLLATINAVAVLYRVEFCSLFY